MKNFLFEFIPILCVYFFGVWVGMHSVNHEPTYSEKRIIAIEFMCNEKWKGVQNFCGKFAMDSKKDEK